MPIFDPAIFDPVVFDAPPVSFPSLEVRVAWRPDQFNLITNPGFETDTSGWSVSAGINDAATSITRVISSPRSGTGAGRLVCPATALTGMNWDFGAAPFFAAATYLSVYRFVVWARSISGTTLARLIVGSEGTSSDRATKDIVLTSEWKPFFVDWAPSATRTDVQLAIVNVPAVAMTAEFDDVAAFLRDAHTQAENGYFAGDTTGWSIGAGINAAATSITFQSSAGYFKDPSESAATCGRLVTTATSGSGTNWDLGTRKFTSGRTYRARVYARSISGTTSARLRCGSLGTVADRGDATVTITTSWAAYEVDWTPTADRTDAEVAITNGAAAIMTVDLDGLEIYEAIDDISRDAFGENGAENFSYGRGASFDGAGQAVGFANYRVVNNTGKYTPENASGALYGLLSSGRRMLVRATYASAPYPVFYGVVKRLVPSPMDCSATIVADDALGLLARLRIRKYNTFLSLHDSKTSTLSGVGGAAVYNYAAENGPTERLGCYRGTGPVSTLDYIAQLSAANAAVYFVRPSVYATEGWEIVFRDRTVHSDASTPSETWNDDMADMSGYDVTEEAFINRQRVAVTAYRIERLNEVAQGYDPPSHSLLDDVDGKFYEASPDLVTFTLPPEQLPLTIPANTTRVLRFEHSPMMQSFGSSVAVTYASGSATKTEDYGAGYLTVTLAAGSVDAVITGIVVSGTPLVRLPLNDEERSDEESVFSEGDYSGADISSPYINHPAHAGGLADWRVWRYGQSRARPSITRHNLFASQLSREVADRVTVNFARLSLSGKVFVLLSFRTSVSQGGRDWQTTYQAEELPATPAGGWFKLGTSALDGSAKLAY